MDAGSESEKGKVAVSSDTEGKVYYRGDPHGKPVLLLHPWWGVTPAVREWTDILVSAGRLVILLDVYHGRVFENKKDAKNAAETYLSDAHMARWVDQKASEINDQYSSWSVMGFSMGAFVACRIAGQGHANLHHMILMYGGQPPRKDSCAQLSVELHIPSEEEYFTEEEQEETCAGLLQAGAHLKIHHYEGCRHWFAERGSPHFDETAFALAKKRILLQLAAPEDSCA